MSYKLFIEKLPTIIQVADINNPDETLINITYQVLALQISNFIKNNTIPFDIKFDNNFIKFETYIDRDNSSYITANNLLTYSNFEYFLKTKVYKNFKDEFDNMIFLDSILNYDRSLNDWGFIVKGNNIGEVVTSVYHPIMYDKTVYHIYLVLAQNTCSLDEIKAYENICNLNYVQEKYELKYKQNLIAEGNASYIKEILHKLSHFKVYYEIEPPYPYE